MPATGQRVAPVEILLIEDNLGDIRLMQQALLQSTLSNHVNVVRDGELAIQYLRRAADYADAVRPNIILLDLNLPKKNGQEVLAEIKADPELRRIPVLILTTSGAKDDVRQSYDNHANCYIVKPISFQEFMEVIRAIEEFWFNLVTLPD